MVNCMTCTLVVLRYSEAYVHVIYRVLASKQFNLIAHGVAVKCLLDYAATVVLYLQGIVFRKWTTVEANRWFLGFAEFSQFV